MLSLALWHVIAAVSAAAIIGVAITWLWLGPRQKMLASQLSDAREQLQQQRDSYETRVNTVTEQLQHTQQLRSNLQAELAAVRAELGAKLQNATEKQQLLEASEERLKKEFERLAQQIFEQKSERLQANSKQTLETTLAPFKQQLEAFKTQVTQQYTEELKQRSALTEQVNSLRDLNKQMAAEAEALTRALKGDTKAQGTWGEVVLERILNQSGLREGQEYETQSHHRDEDGKSFKPDVVVHLPNDKDVVIDSKVSLVAYERYFNSDDDAERESAMNDHVASLRNHIKGLGKKNYQQLESVRTLDYVLMFIPIEPALLTLYNEAADVIEKAWQKKIIIVGPSTLPFLLKAVENMWRIDKQSKTIKDIAATASEIYDKAVNVYESFSTVKQSLDKASLKMDEAKSRLQDGPGSLTKKIDKMKKLGRLNTKKQLPEDSENAID